MRSGNLVVAAADGPAAIGGESAVEVDPEAEPTMPDDSHGRPRVLQKRPEEADRVSWS